MRLRIKKTGEIVEPFGITCINDRTYVQFKNSDETFMYEAHSLAELNEEWEDCEEPKDFWFIDPEILIACESTDLLLCDKKVAIGTMKQIGNYFETREEAEKAVERLRAWKRLKDRGFKIVGRTIGVGEKCGSLLYEIESDVDPNRLAEYFDIIFGGED